MEKPKISIIVPVYNSEEYLEQCLNSLLSQTYKNLEIICVNDGSTDNSPKILEGYQKADERIVVISQENQGQSVARNKGIEASTGDWITFVDSDDWVATDCYNTFVEVINSNSFTPAPVFMFNGTSFKKDKNNPDDLALSDFFSIENWTKKSGEICTFKDCRNPFEGNLSIYNKIYKKEFIEKLHLRFLENSIFEDVLFWIEAFCAAESIYLCDKIFYFYRQQPNSTMFTLNKNVLDIFNILNMVKQKLIQYNRYNMAKYAFLQYKFRQFAFLFFASPDYLREEFFRRAKADLSQENDFDINIIKQLKDFPLYFDFIEMNSEEFYNTYKNCVT